MDGIDVFVEVWCRVRRRALREALSRTTVHYELDVIEAHMLHPNAEAARRATGAMFFIAFGGAWLGLWAYNEFNRSALALTCIAAATAAFFIGAWRVYKANSQALRAGSKSPEEKRRSKVFNYINAGQWILIFGVVNLLDFYGHADFALPAIIFIIGAHFLPLARLFASKAHVFTGLALIAWAVFFSLWTVIGPTGAAGALGAGLILWLSAMWALIPRRSQQNAA
jgi:hypothetical protein